MARLMLIIEKLIDADKKYPQTNGDTVAPPFDASNFSGKFRTKDGTDIGGFPCEI